MNSKFQPIAMIECSTSDQYWQKKRISVYGHKAGYQYLLSFSKILIIDKNSDTGQQREVLVDSKKFYKSLEYFGTYNGSPLNVYQQ